MQFYRDYVLAKYAGIREMYEKSVLDAAQGDKAKARDIKDMDRIGLVALGGGALGGVLGEGTGRYLTGKQHANTYEPLYKELKQALKKRMSYVLSPEGMAAAQRDPYRAAKFMEDTLKAYKVTRAVNEASKAHRVKARHLRHIGALGGMVLGSVIGTGKVLDRRREEEAALKR